MALPNPINHRRLVETFVDLIRIDSPSFQERAIGDKLSRLLASAGCTVEVQEYERSFNLVGRKKGSVPGTPSLLVSGHMDTIEPTEGIEFSTDDLVIRSTGKTVLGADDKSALAQIIEALTVIHERGLPHGDLEIVFTSAEEKGLLGSRNLEFSRLNSGHALVLDACGEVGSLIVSAPTHVTYEMRVTGRSAHAGIEPEAGTNAIRVAAEIIRAIPDGRISGSTTANVGKISGGTATNVVPGEVLLCGELRSLSADELEINKRRIFDTARSIARENDAGLSIVEQEEYRSFTLSHDDPFLQFLCGIFRKLGRESLLVPTGGGSDANIFNERGIKAVNMANGMRRVHSSGEHIYIRDLLEGCRLLLQAMTDFRDFAT
ncbi:MAG: M20/M25/M40 family metallo-hydrolase [Acidobacteriota bacterium]